MNPKITEIFNDIFTKFSTLCNNSYMQFLKIHAKEEAEEVDENSKLHDMLYTACEDNFRELGFQLFCELMANNIKTLEKE